jgi:hypothetical protein
MSIVVRKVHPTDSLNNDAHHVCIVCNNRMTRTVHTIETRGRKPLLMYEIAITRHTKKTNSWRGIVRIEFKTMYFRVADTGNVK